MTVIEIYIVSTTETNSMNGDIMTTLEVYIMIITECDLVVRCKIVHLF